MSAVFKGKLIKNLQHALETRYASLNMYCPRYKNSVTCMSRTEIQHLHVKLGTTLHFCYYHLTQERAPHQYHVKGVSWTLHPTEKAVPAQLRSSRQWNIHCIKPFSKVAFVTYPSWNQDFTQERNLAYSHHQSS